MGHDIPGHRATRGRARVNGTSLYYELTGQGPGLVFIPAEVTDRRLWDDQFRAFARSYTVLRYDLRGFGRSRRGPTGYRHAEDLIALLDQLHMSHIALVGFHVGASIALEVALEHPERVAALILTAPKLRGYRPDTFSPEGAARVEQMLPKIITAGAAWNPLVKAKNLWEIARLSSQPPFAPERRYRAARRRLLAIAVSNVPRAAMMTLKLARTGGPLARWSPWLDPPVARRLGEVRAPTLVLVGEHALPDERWLAEFILTGIAGAKGAEIPGASWDMQMEEPEAFNRVVSDFLASAWRRSDI